HYFSIHLSHRSLGVLTEAESYITLIIQTSIAEMLSRPGQLEEGKELLVTCGRTGLNKAFPIELLLLLVFFLAFSVAFIIVTVSTVKYYGITSVVTSVTSSFVPCPEKPNVLDKWIKPPLALMHNMSDEELLWLASFMPQRKGYPFTRVPKIAFMFLTLGPLPFAPLWERLLKGHEKHYSVYIHSQVSSSAEFPASSVFYRRQIPSQVAEWGRMSICDAERRLLANALLDISNECTYGRGRYNGNMSPEVSIEQWRKGSQWFEVNRELAVSIVKDTLYYPKFKECKDTTQVTPQDFYFQGLATAGAASNTSTGAIVTGATVEKLPGLNTIGLSMSRIDYAPNGLNPPASAQGQLYVGFVTTAGKLVAKHINKGEVFVFPKGLLHFQKNVAKSAPASVIAAFDSQLPGTQSLVSSLFGALPEVLSLSSSNPNRLRRSSPDTNPRNETRTEN
ncbi:hypothetical protein IGI04_001634, partial [Brassica rapa subsp. trilocularis]